MSRISTKTARAVLGRLTDAGAADASSADAPSIEGGALALTPAAFAALLLLPWACDPQVQAALLAAAPGDGGALEASLTLPGIEDDPYQAVNELAASVARLTPGSAFALVTANTGRVRRDREVATSWRLTAGDMRFEGQVDVSRMVRLERASPAVSAERLGAVVAMLERVHDALDSDWGATDAELREARVIGRRSWVFTQHAARAAALAGGDEGAIVVASDMRPYVAMLLLRARFADGPWDLGSFGALDERGKEEWDESQRALAAIAARARGPVRPAAPSPTHDAVTTAGDAGAAPLLATANGRYTAAPILDAAAAFDAHPSLLSNRFYLRDDPRVAMGAPLEFAAAVALVDAAMAEHGLAPLGDLAADALGPNRVRGYAGPGVAGVWAMLVANPASGAFDWSFFSLRAGDGGRWAVTTTHESDAPPPPWALRVEEGAPVGALLDAHRKQLGVLGDALTPAPTTLAELAAAVDAYVMRQRGG